MLYLTLLGRHLLHIWAKIGVTKFHIFVNKLSYFLVIKLRLKNIVIIEICIKPLLFNNFKVFFEK
jgi:hypothetical protein